MDEANAFAKRIRGYPDSNAAPQSVELLCTGYEDKSRTRSAENSSRAPFLGVTLLDNEIAEL